MFQCSSSYITIHVIPSTETFQISNDILCVKKWKNLLWMCFRRKKCKKKSFFFSIRCWKKCYISWKHLLLWEIYMVINWTTTTQSLEKKQSCYFTGISWELYLNIKSLFVTFWHMSYLNTDWGKFIKLHISLHISISKVYVVVVDCVSFSF